MTMRRALLSAALAAFVAVPATAQSIKLPETLTWTAYDVGSGGYNQAVAIGNALKNKLQINLRVLPGKNDVSRNIPLRDGKVPFSANGVGGTYLAQEGLYEFGARDWGPQAVRALILNNSDQLLTVVTAKDANIKTPVDLKGKRVAWVVGSPALNQNVTAVLAFADLTWNDVQKVEFGGFGAAMNGLVSNQVDAAFASSISGPLFKLASSPRGLQYPVMSHSDTESWKRLNKVAPFFVPVKGAEGAELSKDKTVENASYPYPVLMTMQGTDPDLVYNMTKAMVELFDEYKDGAPGNSGWSLQRQIFAWAIPMHDAAIKYFKERGVWTATHQKHNDALIKRQEVLAAAWKAYVSSAPADDKEFANGWMKARAAELTKAGLDVVVSEW
ncbi:MAG: TAXI family TRAP transporter solute-binding subunit [Xanthobacteraceae bacterium]